MLVLDLARDEAQLVEYRQQLGANAPGRQIAARGARGGGVGRAAAHGRDPVALVQDVAGVGVAGRGGVLEGRRAAVTTRHRVQSNVHARAEHATHQWAVVGSGLRNRAISTDCVSEERNKKTTLSVSVSARPRPFVSGRFRGEPSRTFGRHHVFICTFGHVSYSAKF